ncbi:lipocalin family protein [Spirosoma panaciterrae]|uniref:lipocalin family protein n=1 Tax=Spirosoma panaciterrae TaxID=496058 RepID=UPI00036278B9|nr:lipocalin family protein [Spirosoma panaciterrae]
MKTSLFSIRIGLLVCILAMACKKESDVTPNIVGKWQQQAYQYRIVYEVNGSQYDKTGTRKLTSGNTIEFKADGTTSGLSPAYTYTLSGDQITLRYGATAETGKVTLIGDQLTVIGNNIIAGLSEADKLKEAKGWARELNGSSGGDGEYTNISKATKASEVYPISVYKRVN